jgi:Fe-S-cluster containining protein
MRLLEKWWAGLTKKAPAAEENVQIGKYYKRTGSCGQCGSCCKDIHLVHEERCIDSKELFDALKQKHTEYEYFEPVDQDDQGLIFQCTHLQPDNSCGIYETRPLLCRQYPNEKILMVGGHLAKRCGYHFELLRSFQSILDEKVLR